MALKKSQDIVVKENHVERREVERDIDALLNDLHNSSVDIRRWAARDLTNNAQARDTLLSQIEIETDPSVIEALFSSIQGMCDESIAEVFLEKLKSEDAQIRNATIELFQNRPELFAHHVKNLMVDDDVDTRIFAADIIGAISHPDAKLWLHEMALNDDDINVVGTAIDKLNEVGDRSSIPILQEVKARFPKASYIQFAADCVCQTVEDVDE